MPLELRHTRAARRDLQSIWRYIAQDNLSAADGQLRRLADVAKTLTEVPLIGRARPELRPNLRSFPVRRYVVFFEVNDTTVNVVRVIDSARKLVPDMFDDDSV